MVHRVHVELTWEGLGAELSWSYLSDEGVSHVTVPVKRSQVKRSEPIIFFHVDNLSRLLNYFFCRTGTNEP